MAEGTGSASAVATAAAAAAVDTVSKLKQFFTQSIKLTDLLT